MQGPRTTSTAWAVIQGIEAAQMIRKGQVLGLTRQICLDKRGYLKPSWVFKALLDRKGMKLYLEPCPAGNLDPVGKSGAVALC